MIHLPVGCPRALANCSPLARIESDDESTFVCVGRNDGTGRRHEQDEFAHCAKSADVDRIDHVDRLDLIDQAAVANAGLSAILRGA